MLPCQKKNPKLSKFMFEKINGMLKSGLIERTTCAKYKGEANLILRFIDSVPVHKVTAAMAATGLGSRLTSSRTCSTRTSGGTETSESRATLATGARWHSVWSWGWSHEPSKKRPHPHPLRHLIPGKLT